MQRKITEMPAYMLLRKSQADKAEEARAALTGRVYDALANQFAALEILAARDGVTIPEAHVFREVKSGESLKARAEFQRLLGLLKALPRPGALLYVVTTARVSRGLLTERGMLQDLFIEQGVLIRTQEGITDLSVADERLLYEFKGALAHHYLLRYKEDVARTRMSQVHNGRVRNGSVPFGYLWDKEAKLPRPHPAEFPILKAICEEAFHTSTCELAERYGLSQQRVLRILRSPMICGWPAKTVAYRPGSKALYYLPRDQWVWPEAQAPYERAMEREDWERLQEILTRRKWGYQGKSHTANGWCRDVVEFSERPGPVRLGSYKSPAQAFDTYERRETRDARRLYVNRRLVHTAVGEAIRRVVMDPDLLGRLWELKGQQDRKPTTGAEIPSLLARQEKLTRTIKRYDEMEAEAEPERIQGIRDLRAAAIEEHRANAARMVQLNSQAPVISGEEAGRLATVVELLREDFEPCWEGLPDNTKRLLVIGLVERVSVMIVRLGHKHVRRVTVCLRDWVDGHLCR